MTIKTEQIHFQVEQKHPGIQSQSSKNDNLAQGLSPTLKRI